MRENFLLRGVPEVTLRVVVGTGKKMLGNCEEIAVFRNFSGSRTAEVMSQLVGRND